MILLEFENDGDMDFGIGGGHCPCSRIEQIMGGTGKEWIGDMSGKKIATYRRFDNKIIRTGTARPMQALRIDIRRPKKFGLIFLMRVRTVGLVEKVRYKRSKENDDDLLYLSYLNHHHSCHNQ